MTRDEALRMAIEAIENADYHNDLQAIAVIKKMLTQLEITTGNILMDSYNAMQSMKVEGPRHVVCQCDKCKAQPEQDNIYAYASSLAKTIWQKHYIKESPKFALLDTTEGVLTQIDNMTCGLVREKPAQPEQDTNKNGSPCPEFWDWLPKAYNFEGNGNFTKYNMEVAFLAGKQASHPEQEPVAWVCHGTRGHHDIDFLEEDVDSLSVGTNLYTTPPQRTWVGLTDEEWEAMYYKFAKHQEYGAFVSGWDEFARAIEAKLKEKNT